MTEKKCKTETRVPSISEMHPRPVQSQFVYRIEKEPLSRNKPKQILNTKMIYEIIERIKDL